MRKRFRSGLLALVLPVFLSVFSGCTEQVRPELDETHAKLQALQELADAVNWDLHILDLIVKELDDGHTILPETYRLTEDGYEVSFRDGKTIVIPFGKDGVDGRQFIPVGVQDDEDGLYYWKVEGEWLRDSLDNRIRAGARDGIVPQFKVEDGFWWISIDGGLTYSKLASCEEMDGLGVFRSVEQTPFGTVVLTLWDGETVEISSSFPFRMSFEGPARDTVLIAAGETLPIPYKVIVEGESEQPLTIMSGTDGVYLSSVEAADDTTGVVKVQAPADYADGYIFLTASCGSYSAMKMITFRPRKTTPEESFLTIRLGSGDDPLVFPYEANFEYDIKTSQDGSWIDVVADMEAGSLTFTPQPNTGSKVRSCEVIISPKDNPDHVCTTIRVFQATDSFSVQLEEGSPFSFDPDTKTLYAPAEGGDATLWISFLSTLSVSASVPDTADWLETEMTDEGNFRRLRVRVAPTETGDGRESSILVSLQTVSVPIGEIKVIQAGKPASN